MFYRVHEPYVLGFWKFKFVERPYSAFWSELRDDCEGYFRFAGLTVIIHCHYSIATMEPEGIIEKLYDPRIRASLSELDIQTGCMYLDLMKSPRGSAHLAAKTRTFRPKISSPPNIGIEVRQLGPSWVPHQHLF